jgi:hypothetical protein
LRVPDKRVDGKVVDNHSMPPSLPVNLPWDETSCVAVYTGTAVDDRDYQVPFRSTGKLDKLTVKVGPMETSPEEKGKMAEVFRNKQ